MKKINVELKKAYAMLHPRPAVLISAFWKKPNVMACAWTTPVCDDPAVIAIVLGDQSYTAKMIKNSGEFVVNIPSRKLVKQIHHCGNISGKDIDKAKKFGLTYAPAKKIKAPVIKECSGHIECKVLEIIKFDECNLIVGKVLAAYATNDFKGYWKAGVVPEHVSGDIFSVSKFI